MPRLFVMATYVIGLWLSVAPVYGSGPADFLVNELSIIEFKRTIADLVSMQSRYWNQPGNAVAVAYIKTKLESFGYTNVVLDPYSFQGTRYNIYATKMGTLRPTEMYIVSAHMDSYSTVSVADAPGADDDGSGTALVLEIARVFAAVQPEISVRFILFNNEETGLNGSAAYVANHRTLQGTLEEPTWLGVIQHDMILYDHFAVPDADVEYQALHDFGGQAIVLGQFVAGAMARYGSIPAEVSDNMNNTDSKSFWSDIAAISVRENRRLAEIGAGSNPHYHQPSDRPESYSDADYEFGFNIVKMTAGAIVELSNATPVCAGEPVTTECRPVVGVCDAAEFCDGAGNCPVDGFLPQGTECRASAGVCDGLEFCTGSSTACPPNGFQPNTVECRAENDDCDVPEFCTGSGVDCPADAFAQLGAPCPSDGDECTDDICNGAGICLHPNNQLCGACCLPDKNCLNDMSQTTCQSQFGEFLGTGSACLGDSDNDGIDDQCDNCPGVDDDLFTFRECDPSGKRCTTDADCPTGESCVKKCPNIPTVSEWGLVILALLLMVGGKVYFGRRPSFP